MALLTGPYFINLDSTPRSFPNALCVQSSVGGTAPAWHRLNPVVMTGASLLQNSRLAAHQKGACGVCQENCMTRSVPETQVITSFNYPLSLQKVDFHIFV